MKHLVFAPLLEKIKMTSKDRIHFRRDSTLMHLIHYLQDPKYISKMKDFFGHKIRKTDITNLAIS